MDRITLFTAKVGFFPIFIYIQKQDFAVKNPDSKTVFIPSRFPESTHKSDLGNQSDEAIKSQSSKTNFNDPIAK